MKLSAIGLVFLCACAASAPSGRNIYTYPNGYTTNSYPQVGMVLGSRGMCTGTAIALDVILTAAHCAEGVGPKESIIKLNGNEHVIEEWVVIPHRDVAFGTVSLPPGTPHLNLSTAYLDFAGTLEFVGYGCSAVDEDAHLVMPAGIKRITNFRLTDVSGSSNPTKNPGQIVFRAEGLRVCPGDSGGPVISRENHKIVGIVVAYQEYGKDHQYTGSVVEDLIPLAKLLLSEQE